MVVPPLRYCCLLVFQQLPKWEVIKTLRGSSTMWLLLPSSSFGNGQIAKLQLPPLPREPRSDITALNYVTTSLTLLRSAIPFQPQKRCNNSFLTRLL